MSPVGERHSHAKLTEPKVREIRSRLARGEGQRPLAAEYGMSPSAIHDIARRRKWAHVAIFGTR